MSFVTDSRAPPVAGAPPAYRMEVQLRTTVGERYVVSGSDNLGRSVYNLMITKPSAFDTNYTLFLKWMDVNLTVVTNLDGLAHARARTHTRR
jgi:hypothetical protein